MTALTVDVVRGMQRPPFGGRRLHAVLVAGIAAMLTAVVLGANRGGGAPLVAGPALDALKQIAVAEARANRDPKASGEVYATTRGSCRAANGPCALGAEAATDPVYLLVLHGAFRYYGLAIRSDRLGWPFPLLTVAVDRRTLAVTDEGYGGGLETSKLGQPLFLP